MKKIVSFMIAVVTVLSLMVTGVNGDVLAKEAKDVKSDDSSIEGGIKEEKSVYADSSDFTFTLKPDFTYEITKYKGSGGVVDIPESYNGYPVTSINSSAFNYCYGLGSVSIPDTITRIESSTFSGRGIKSIRLPNNLTYIGDSAFRGNYMTEIKIPDSVTYIGDAAFRSCELESVSIPDRVTEIKASAFSYNQLKSVVLPKNLKKIDNNAFIYNSITGIVFPSSLEEIGNYAFLKAFSDENPITISIPKSVKIIGNYAFANNSNITEFTVLNRKCALEGSGVIPTGVILKGYNKSTLKSFASSYARPFKAIPCNHSSGKIEKILAKATLSNNGYISNLCDDCGEERSRQTIYRPKSISLEKKSFKYDGKKKVPAVIVKDSDGKVIKPNKGVNYSVSYPKGMKNPGTYTVSVTFNGNYVGTKDLKFDIKRTKYTIKFDKNGGNGKKMKTLTAKYGKKQKLSKNKYTKKGYKFIGWATSKARAKKLKVDYNNAESVKDIASQESGTITLYAVWRKTQWYDKKRVFYFDDYESWRSSKIKQLKTVPGKHNGFKLMNGNKVIFKYDERLDKKPEINKSWKRIFSYTYESTGNSMEVSYHPGDQYISISTTSGKYDGCFYYGYW